VLNETENEILLSRKIGAVGDDAYLTKGASN
jgi:hypothetical protein